MNIWLAEIWRAWRASFRRPGFLLLSTGVLALGIGASVAAFALIDNLLLKPLPYPQPQNLFALEPAQGRNISTTQFEQMHFLHGVESIGLLEAETQPVNVSSGGTAELARGMYIDHALLPTLGLSVALGRNFSAQEDRPHGPAAVMISHGYWLRHFAGDVHVIGRRMQVEGVAHTIIGVLPTEFDRLGRGDVILPAAVPSTRSSFGLYVAVARLSDARQSAAVAAQVSARLPADAAAQGSQASASTRIQFAAKDLRSVLAGNTVGQMALFQASALLVLLVALVNLTNLMVLGALSHGHEAAIRGALGASGVRLLLPALAQGLLVGVVGTALGIGVATGGLAMLHHFVAPEWMGGAVHVRVGIWLLALTVGLSMALFAALLGLWRGRTAAGLDELREGGGRTGFGLRSGRLGRALVVMQVVLATMLLSATAMFAHAQIDDSYAPPGFATQEILTFALKPVQATYPGGTEVAALARRITTTLRGLPGVTDATVATSLPIGLSGSQRILQPDGRALMVQYRAVDSGYFSTLGISLRVGRTFTTTDVRGGARVAVVSQGFAQHEFNGHALGKTLGTGAMQSRIVGVVADTHRYGFLPRYAMYVPLAQVPAALMQLQSEQTPLAVALRVRGDPNAYRQAVHAAVSRIDPAQPIAGMRSMAQLVHDETFGARTNLLMMGLLTGLALILAAIGIYAVMAVAVAARQREFGVRAALGASPARIIRHALRSGLRQIAIGLLIGLVLALAVCVSLRALFVLLGRSAMDPWALAATCVVLAAVGLLACLRPAWSAGRVTPMHALRSE